MDTNLNSEIKNVRVFHRALTDEEIQALGTKEKLSVRLWRKLSYLWFKYVRRGNE